MDTCLLSNLILILVMFQWIEGGKYEHRAKTVSISNCVNKG